jgi:hypothetical protein
VAIFLHLGHRKHRALQEKERRKGMAPHELQVYIEIEKSIAEIETAKANVNRRQNAETSRLF